MNEMSDVICNQKKLISGLDVNAAQILAGFIIENNYLQMCVVFNILTTCCV